MSESLPLMNAYGQIEKVFDKMHLARKPSKFTQDFLETKLGFKSKSTRAIIPLLVKLNFITSDKIPTELYSEFQNPTKREAAVAKGMKRAYASLFDVNTYIGEASDTEIEGVICQVTGLGKEEDKFKNILKTFLNLKKLANFDPIDSIDTNSNLDRTNTETSTAQHSSETPAVGKSRFGWSYNINLNLPETTDIEVFDAIFSSMKKHFPDFQ